MKKFVLISALLFSFNVSAKDMYCGVTSTDYIGKEEKHLSEKEVMKEIELKCKKGDLLIYRNTSQLVFTSLSNVSVRVCDPNKPINVIKETLSVIVPSELESLLCSYNGSIREQR